MSIKNPMNPKPKKPSIPTKGGKKPKAEPKVKKKKTLYDMEQPNPKTTFKTTKTTKAKIGLQEFPKSNKSGMEVLSKVPPGSKAPKKSVATRKPMMKGHMKT